MNGMETSRRASRPAVTGRGSPRNVALKTASPGVVAGEPSSEGDWRRMTVLATASADGCDASPKGDPAGSLVHVIDDVTIALAERPGNKRADGYQNILNNPHVGLLFVIPGRGDTLRINGRARLDEGAPLGLVVDPEAVLGDCPE